MIFTTKNKELAILGNTSIETREKLIKFFEAFERGGINGQDGIIDTFFSSKKKSPLTPELLSDFENFKKIFNNSQLSAEALAEQMKDVDQRIINYAKTCKNGELTTEGFTTSIEGMSLSAKAGKAVLQTLAAAGNMVVFVLLSKGIELAVNGIDNWIHRVEKSNEAMNEAVSEYNSAKSNLENINSELDEQNQKMDELLAKDSLTYAEKGQLEELKAITKELSLQQDIEEKRVGMASKEAAEKTVNAFDKQYGKYDKTQDSLDEKIGYNNFPLPSDEDDVLGNIAAYVRSRELLEQAQLDYDNALKNGDDTTWLADDLQGYIDMTDDYSQLLNNNLSDLLEKHAALEDEYTKAIDKRDSGAGTLTSSEQEIIDTYETIYDVVKMVYEYTNRNAWNDMAVKDIFNTQGIEKTKEELIAISKAGELTPEALKQYPKLYNAIKNSELFFDDDQTAAEAFCNEIIACADEAGNLNDSLASTPPPVLSPAQTITQLNTQLKPALDTLSTAWQNIFANDTFSLDSTDILSTCDAIRARLDEMSRAGLNVDYSSYDNFVRVLYDSESEVQDVENAFNSLSSSMTKAVLTGAEDFDVMKAVLEDLGSTNSEMDAFTTLISNTEALKEAGLDLAAVSQMEESEADAAIRAFADEAVSAENLEQAINLLKIQKILCNDNWINSTKDINDLYVLALAAGIATDAIGRLSGLKAEYDTAVANNDTMVAKAIQSQMNSLKGEIESQFAGLSETSIDLSSLGGNAGTAAHAGRSAGANYVDAFEKELDNLKESRDQGKITEKEYLDYLRKLYQHFFRDKQKYAKEYDKYEQEYLQGMKSLYESALSGVTSILDKQINAYEDSKSAAVDSLEAERDARIEVLEAQKDQYEEQIKLIEKQIALEQMLN